MGPSWSNWYCDYTHLEIWKGGYFGGGSDIATIQIFNDGTCSLWIYNTKDKNMFTESEVNTTWHKSADEAMTAAETRFGVRAIRPAKPTKQ